MYIIHCKIIAGFILLIRFLPLNFIFKREKNYNYDVHNCRLAPKVNNLNGEKAILSMQPQENT